MENEKNLEKLSRRVILLDTVPIGIIHAYVPVPYIGNATHPQRCTMHANEKAKSNGELISRAGNKNVLYEKGVCI